jgi:hypothetical protein
VCIWMGYQALGVSTAGREKERERRTGIGWAVYHMLRARRFPAYKNKRTTYVRLGLDVEGCWAGRTRYLMIEEGLSPLMVGKT